MNRLKILLLVLIVAILATVFVQNREPIALKLLCEDPSSQYCLYQTPQLPLAVWISLFILGGTLTNLLSQTFSRYSYSSSGKKRYVKDDLYPEKKGWVERDDEPEKYSTTSIERENKISSKANDSKVYEVTQEPEETTRSGSNYSYKYRSSPKEEKSKNKADNTSIDLDKNVNSNSELEDEDWI